MKLSTTSRLWTGSIVLLAVVFVFSSAALIYSILNKQQTLVAGDALLEQVQDLTRLARQATLGIPGEPPMPGDDAAFWDQHYRSFSEGLTAAVFHESASEDIRADLIAVDALVRGLGEQRPHLAVTGTQRYRAQVAQATALLQEITHRIESQMLHLAKGQFRQWPFVILILLIACLLALYSAIISRAHQTGTVKRERVEQEVNMLAHAIRSIGDSVTVTDMENRLLFVNDAFLRTYGYDRKEVIGQKIDLTRAEENPAELIHKIFPATLKGGWSGELLNKRKDGSVFPVTLTTAIVRDDRDKPIAMVGVSTDITQRKESERLLIDAKEKAEEAVKLKSAFLANMSHEIRTPLTAILGFASILSEEVDEGLREFAQLIENNGRRLLETLNSVLDLARLEANGIDVHPERLDLIEEVKSSVRMLWPLANERGLRLEVDASMEEIEAEVDKTCLGRVLNNLIGNAIKFTERGRVTVELEAKGAWAKIHVRDTGIGISEEFLPQIFEEFKQESSGVDRSHEGSGLGLAITRRLVELMWGTIEVESVKGFGSCFTITLPRFVDEKKARIEARAKKATEKAPAPTVAAELNWL